MVVKHLEGIVCASVPVMILVLFHSKPKADLPLWIISAEWLQLA